jgi:hypothetical protein
VVLPDDETRALLRGEELLLSSASEFLPLLVEAAAGQPHALMLSDDQCYVLRVLGDAETVFGPRCVPGPGTLTSEQTCGTNAISAALAEGALVRVHKSEHYVRMFQEFSCVGAPIFSYDGSATGSLCLAAREGETASRLEPLVLCAARAIEADMVARHLDAQIRDLGRHNNRRRAELLEVLASDLIDMHRDSKACLRRAGKAFGRNEKEAFETLSVAQSLAARFRRRAELWRELAMPSPVYDELLYLRDEIADVSRLLAVCDPRFSGPPVRIECEKDLLVIADRKRLRRRLMAQLSRLRGMILCPQAIACVAVTTRPESDLASIQVSVALGPDPNDRRVLEVFETPIMRKPTSHSFGRPGSDHSFGYRLRKTDTEPLRSAGAGSVKPIAPVPSGSHRETP